MKLKNLFEYDIDNNTRTNEHKLKLKCFQTNFSKNFFTHKINPVWNALLVEVF